MILVVLALVWAVALTPTVLRKLAERRSSYSVDRFHHSLHAIQFAGPDTRAANRVAVRAVSHGERFPLTGTTAAAAPYVMRTEPGLRVGATTARRRRQVLGSLAGAVVCTLLLGFMPGMRVFWDMAIVFFIAFTAYIGLLVYFRRLALERSRKVVSLASIRPVGVRSFTRPTLDTPRAPALVIGG